MSEDRWHRIEDVFHRAADLAAPERNAFLDSACGGDEDLRREVESLLAADADPDPVLEAAVAEASAKLDVESDESATLIGQRIGPYAIASLIGKGGMGAVYRAVRDGEFRMEVALKLLKRGTDTEAALGHFRRERQILAALQHPNIARLLDGGATEEGLPYFAMEYVDGTPLLEYVVPLSIRQRLELFRSVCAAVQYAHQNLIVHRDLKPGNILVTADGTPKLLDFGIARISDPESPGDNMTLTIAGARLLTPDYASPEQVRGEPVTTASDIYSLGVVLYELLTGERPYRIETYSHEAIERAICGDEPRKPSALNRQLDQDLDNIVLMAVRKEPQRRYASVEQLSEDLRRYLEGRPVRARKDTLGYRAGKFIRRNKPGLTVAALAAIGLATGVAAINRQARRAEYRFQQVHKFARTVLFDLNPEIERLAGSTRARELLVKTSLEYLDSLASEAGGDPSLQLELAEAYEKIGDVQGNPKFSNLGHPEAALESYGKSLAIARKLRPSLPALELLARNYSEIGTVQYWGLGRYPEALENLRLAVLTAASIPGRSGNPAYRVRAEMYGLLGDIDETKHPERASGPYRQSLDIAQEWARAQPSPESRYFLARATARWGEILRDTGDLTGAIHSKIGALRIIDNLLEKQPENAKWRRLRNLFLSEIGMISGHPQYFNLGDPKVAAVWLQKAVDGFEQLMAGDAYDFEARLALSSANGDLAAVIGESDPTRGEQLYRRSLALGVPLLQSHPLDTTSRDTQAIHRVGFARVLRRLGKRGEALAELQKAVKILEGLCEQSPENIEFRRHLAEALDDLAAQRLEENDDGGAERALQRSLGLLEPIDRENPRDLFALRDLAGCYEGFGDLAASRSDWRQARLQYQKSLDLWEHWKEVGVSSVYDRQRRDLAARLVERAARKTSGNPPSR